MHRPSISGCSPAFVAVALFAAACGGAGSSGETQDPEPSFRVQGAQNVQTDPTTSTTQPADDNSAGAAEGEDPGADTAPTFDQTESTLPTNDEEDADGEFFDAVGDFMACLTTEGYGFLGIPSEDLGETAPVNNPGYIDALRTCAASSQIVSKMEAAEDTSDMTTEEIEESNRQFGLFVDCLEGLGWEIPTPTPDENGVLQPRYVDIARTWTPPDGTSFLADGSLNTDDFRDCNFAGDLPD